MFALTPPNRNPSFADMREGRREGRRAPRAREPRVGDITRAALITYDRVEARGLVKTFGATRALAGVDATFPEGVTTVVEGANGAGKSTLMGILSLLVKPSRGTLRFGEHDGFAEAGALRGTVGVLAHSALLYPDLSGFENLQLTASLHGLAQGVAKTRLERAMERYELGAFLDRPARTYSRGQLQRLALARALLHQPKLVLLDEPSTGLDAASTKRLVHVVDEERARGAIVVVVTHDEAFAEAIATARLRLARGRTEAR